MITLVLERHVLERRRVSGTLRCVLGHWPKEPWRTKNAMALENVVFYYSCSVLLLAYQFAAILPPPPKKKKQHLQTLRSGDSLWP